MDPNSREALSKTLSRLVKRASTTVRNVVEAERGDFKVELANDKITQIFQGDPVGSVKVAELEDPVIEAINSDPQKIAEEWLDEFMTSFDKQAAHATQDTDTSHRVTEKQFDEQKLPLHPRPGVKYDNVQEKQLPEHDQRPGTYDQVTEGQMRDTKSTFYQKPMESGQRKGEDRNIVTEKQMAEGIGDYSDVATNDRGETGAELDGGLAEQQSVIGQKQLRELLQHHEWTEPHTVTEGKDQLGKQDGELARLTAETAANIIKLAEESLGKTVVATGALPKDLAYVVHRMVSHPSKLPVLASVIDSFRPIETNSVNVKVAKARQWGISANASQDYQPADVADILISQLAKSANDSRHIVKTLTILAEDPSNLTDRIDNASKSVLSDDFKEAAQNDNDDSVLRQVLAGDETEMKDDSVKDGLWEYSGTIDEVSASVDDREKFSEEAKNIAMAKIASKMDEKIELMPVKISVDESLGVFRALFKDAKKEEKELADRAEQRRKMAAEGSQTKEAQAVGGGGVAPAPGGDAMGNQQAPMGAGDMAGPPPAESMSAPPVGPEAETEGEALPPGSVCGMCGSKNVNVDNGDIECEDCGSKGTVEVLQRWKQAPGIIEESEAAGEEGVTAEEALDATEEPGLAAPSDGEAAPMPSVPIGASSKLDFTKSASNSPFGVAFHLNHVLLEKLAAMKVPFGMVCPGCGRTDNSDVRKSASGNGYDGYCWHCNQEWNLQVRGSKKKKHQVFAQVIWMPKYADQCSDCNRLQASFKESLANYGMEWNDFVELKDMRKQADVVLNMSKAGALDIIGAMTDSLPISRFAASSRWRGVERFDKFPSASCRERISRKYGENATALSGPCNGKKLAECVCGQLEDLGIYTDGLAAKVAKTLTSQDLMVSTPVEECVAMLVRDGYQLKDSCVACDGLRAAFAGVGDLIVEGISQHDPFVKQAQFAAPMAEKAMPMEDKSMPMPSKSMPGEEEADPLDNPAVAIEDGPPDEGIEVEVISEPGAEQMPDKLDIGLDEDTFSVSLDDVLGKIEEAFALLHQALTGSAPEDAIEDESPLDMGDVTDDTVGLEDDIDESDGGEIPPIDDEISDEITDEDTPPIEEESDGPPEIEDDDKDCAKPLEAPKQMQKKEAPAAKEAPAEKEECGCEKEKCKCCGAASETDDMTKAASTQSQGEGQAMDRSTEAAQYESELIRMKTGGMSRSRDALSNVFNGLVGQLKKMQPPAEGQNKQAQADTQTMERKTNVKEDKITESPVQDQDDIGTVSTPGESTIGQEDKFDADDPDVPRKDQLLGAEDKDKVVNDSTNNPTVPHGGDDMPGESDQYAPEKGNVVDGNQGAQTQASTKANTKTAKANEDDEAEEDPKKDTDEKDDWFANMIQKKKDKKKKASTQGQVKIAKQWTVTKDNKMWGQLLALTEKDQFTVRLADKQTYEIDGNDDGAIILTAYEKAPGIKKEAEDRTLNREKSLENDEDLGKVKNDQTHALAVTEKKPSEGMSEPSVPEAPNDGRLSREETVDTPKDTANIPAGGGQHPQYDRNEKNTPEKQERILGKENDLSAMASTQVDRTRAAKVAGQMLKAGKIEIAELEEKIQMLSQLDRDTLQVIEGTLKEASNDEHKGLEKEASQDTVESVVPVTTAGTDTGEGSFDERVQKIASAFTLSKRINEFEDLNQRVGEGTRRRRR